jgi:hypothetical protein
MRNKIEIMTNQNNLIDYDYIDIENILLNAASEAILIGGLTNIVFNSIFSPNKLTLNKISKNILGNFISYGIRDLSLEYLDDMQYVSGFVRGYLKGEITSDNPFYIYDAYDSGFSTLNLEICNFHMKSSTNCKLMLEPFERGIFEGLIYASIAIGNKEVIYPLLNPLENINYELFSLSDNACLLGENDINHDDIILMIGCAY